MPFLYLIQSQTYYKIGIAQDVASRLSGLKTGNPNQMDLILLFEFNDPYCIEKALHQRFASKMIQGEWFALDASEIQILDEICWLLGGIPRDIEQAEAQPVFQGKRRVSEASSRKITEDDFLYFIQEILLTSDWSQAAWRGRTLPSGYTMSLDTRDLTGAIVPGGYTRLMDRLIEKKIIINRKPKATGIWNPNIPRDAFKVLEILNQESL